MLSKCGCNDFSILEPIEPTADDVVPSFENADEIPLIAFLDSFIIFLPAFLTLGSVSDIIFATASLTDIFPFPTAAATSSGIF